ncbi:High osmolarity signaling protein sho1 [Choanephora cucurbitarum]|uniref:High osmolarity signaling protein sho1 n=1 Tax=Choanephora cucurbitarum TaxID=101091 RepID=A0A1C7N1N2_9FUNG|nr:High osmolarity signaling protein sho1 [Choanephora cucurbitarum]
MAICGWIIAFSGACILKVLHGAWWVIVYQFCIVSGHLLIFLTGSTREYRIVMVAVLASSIPMLTIQVDYVVQLTKTSIPSVPGNAYVSGYIILIIVHYAWLFVLGSEETTWLGRLRESGDCFGKGQIEPGNIVEKTVEYESPAQLVDTRFAERGQPLNACK